MPNWTINAIWIFMSLWSLWEVSSLYVIIYAIIESKGRYTNEGRRSLCLWVFLMVFWVSYRVWG